jgi:SNF family Na+-dependent transporter
MKIGSWVILTVLLAILAAAVWFAYEGLLTEPDVQVSEHGYIAMALGIFFSLAIGLGLMTLVFYSSRAGYDEPARRVDEQNQFERRDPHR